MSKYLSLALVLSLVLMSLLDFESAFALSKKLEFAENNPIADFLCTIFGSTQGIVGRVVVAFVIIVTGVGFLLGKGSWGILFGLAIGAIIMFTSEGLIGKLTGQKARGGCGCKYGVTGEHCPQNISA
jgi:type IV secretory pathway VirB2 component (pilin)